MAEVEGIINLVNDLKNNNIITYYTVILILMILLSFILVRNIKQNNVKAIDYIFVILYVLLIIQEPIMFIISLSFLVFMKMNDIRDLRISRRDCINSKCIKQRKIVLDRENFNLLDILFLYNFISYKNYMDLYENHSDLDEEQMIEILETEYILDSSKKREALKLLNDYKITGQLKEEEEGN